MKYQIQIAGHAEIIDLKKNADGTVDGTITSPEGGVGTVHGSWSGNSIAGEIELSGHRARFTASELGNTLNGQLDVKVGWIWVTGPSFTGQLQA